MVLKFLSNAQVDAEKLRGTLPEKGRIKHREPPYGALTPLGKKMKRVSDVCFVVGFIAFVALIVYQKATE